jgi:molybdopterin synthase catalytic subunit
MTIDVRLYAILRERSGRDRVQLELPLRASVADALRGLAAIEPLGELLARLPVRLAVNRDYGAPETILEPGDELALIPPVSGGAASAGPAARAAAPHVRITREPLSLDALARAVGDPGAGAIVIFQGVTREVERLEYEAYAEMAHAQIEAIMRECIAAHDLRGAAVEHRVGAVALGEPSVIVAVSAAHREQAFAAAREAIDRVKEQAPIWKREHPAGAPASWVHASEPTL